MEKLRKRHVKYKFEALRGVKTLFKGVPSWVKYMRKALGMTPSQLAARMGIAKSTLHQLERQEVDHKISMKTLLKAAEIMECEVVYALIPRRPVEEIKQEQALKKAKRILEVSTLQMEYEDQSVEARETRAQLEDLCEKIKNSKHLWED